MPDRTLDLRHLRCPLPVLKTEAAVRAMGAGDVLEVLADDPIAGVDIPHALRGAGHEVERLSGTDGLFRFRITVARTR